MQDEPPFFSVIVPTYNRPERLHTCLRALAALRYPRHRYEVVVVDDGGTVSLAPVVDPVRNELDVTLLQQANSGPAAARNKGADHARGDYLAFTDDDCMPEADWLQVFARQTEHTPDRMLGGRTVNALPENIFASASQRLIDYLYGYYNESEGRDSFFASNNMVVPRAQYRSVGGFDTTFRRAAGEDRAFCNRWLCAGLSMEYVPAAVSYHAHELNMRTFWLQHFNYGCGAYAFHRMRSGGGQTHVSPEPLQFYINLLSFPFQKSRKLSAWKESVLLGISQIANAAGFFWEKFHSERRIT